MGKLKEKWIQTFKTLPGYALLPWYPYLLGALAFSDYFIFMVPLDALVVGSFLAARPRWLRLNWMASLGSTLGAVLFAFLIDRYGTGILERLMPSLLNSEITRDFSVWLHKYGFLALLGAAILPIHQHPTVAVAAVAKVPLSTIFFALLLGRFLKYCIYYALLRSAHGGIRRFFRE